MTVTKNQLSENISHYLLAIFIEVKTVNHTHKDYLQSPCQELLLFWSFRKYMYPCPSPREFLIWITSPPGNTSFNPYFSLNVLAPITLRGWRVRMLSGTTQRWKFILQGEWKMLERYATDVCWTKTWFESNSQFAHLSTCITKCAVVV